MWKSCAIGFRCVIASIKRERASEVWAIDFAGDISDTSHMPHVVMSLLWKLFFIKKPKTVGNV